MATAIAPTSGNSKAIAMGRAGSAMRLYVAWPPDSSM